jgi:hypothetical protein
VSLATSAPRWNKLTPARAGECRLSPDRLRPPRTLLRRPAGPEQESRSVAGRGLTGLVFCDCGSAYSASRIPRSQRSCDACARTPDRTVGVGLHPDSMGPTAAIRMIYTSSSNPWRSGRFVPCISRSGSSSRGDLVVCDSAAGEDAARQAGSCASVVVLGRELWARRSFDCWLERCGSGP